MKKIIKGYKAFNEDMTCRGFQYKEGETYTTDKEAIICRTGFHFCEDPLDVLSYYDITKSVIHEVEGEKKGIDKCDQDSKIATTEIKIGARLSLKRFIEASFDFIFKSCKVKKTTYSTQAASGDSSKQAASGYSSKQAAIGDYSKQAASGDYSKQAASGDYSTQAASGYSSTQAASGYSSKQAASGYSSTQAASGDSSTQAASGYSSTQELNGQDSIAAGIGRDSKIRGKKGNWITLAEWKWDDKKNRYVPVCVKSAKIDGKKIKEDIWYKLENKKFTEVK